MVHVPEGEDRPRLAVEAAEAFAANPCDETRDAAWAAARDAWATAWATARDAAWAAAWSARDAARDAAWAAAWATARSARDAENKAQADAIRAIWPKVGV